MQAGRGHGNVIKNGEKGGCFAALEHASMYVYKRSLLNLDEQIWLNVILWWKKSWSWPSTFNCGLKLSPVVHKICCNGYGKFPSEFFSFEPYKKQNIFEISQVQNKIWVRCNEFFTYEDFPNAIFPTTFTQFVIY